MMHSSLSSKDWTRQGGPWIQAAVVSWTAVDGRIPGPAEGLSGRSMAMLPDYLRRGMKLIVVGCNPGDRSSRVGHHYAGRGNEFWPLMYEAGILPELLEAKDDKRVIEFGVGLTDLVKRSTRSPDEIQREEFAEGRILLAQKLEEFVPRVVAFNGAMVYEKFAQGKCKFGLQKKKLYGAHVFVLPSSSANGITPGLKKRYFRQLGVLLQKLD
jgi:double-stranded uracil-DNA glycosylase